MASLVVPYRHRRLARDGLLGVIFLVAGSAPANLIGGLCAVSLQGGQLSPPSVIGIFCCQDIGGLRGVALRQHIAPQVIREGVDGRGWVGITLDDETPRCVIVIVFCYCFYSASRGDR